MKVRRSAVSIFLLLVMVLSLFMGLNLNVNAESSCTVTINAIYTDKSGIAKAISYTTNVDDENKTLATVVNEQYGDKKEGLNWKLDEKDTPYTYDNLATKTIRELYQSMCRVIQLVTVDDSSTQTAYSYGLYSLEDGVSMGTIEFNSTDIVVIPECDYIRDGYEFKGWTYQPIEGKPLIFPGEKYTGQELVDFINQYPLNCLYAMWANKSSENGEYPVAISMRYTDRAGNIQSLSYITKINDEGKTLDEVVNEQVKDKKTRLSWQIKNDTTNTEYDKISNHTIKQLYSDEYKRISLVAEDDESFDDLKMYRMFNPNSGEHLYTAAELERDDLINKGWQYEGYGFIASTNGNPVYRLYNPHSGEHHYTVDENEKNYLAFNSWNYEGIGWYSKDTGSDCEKKMYRLFNPNATGPYEAGSHHYTLDENEKNYLVRNGWNYEGTSWVSAHNILGDGSYKEATCVSTGYSGNSSCLTCGNVYLGQETPKNASIHKNTTHHDAVWDYVNFGNENTIAVVVSECKLCGRKFSPYQHTYGTTEEEEIGRHFRIMHGYQASISDYSSGASIETQARLGEYDSSPWLYQYWHGPFVSFEMIDPDYTHCNDCGKDYR